VIRRKTTRKAHIFCLLTSDTTRVLPRNGGAVNVHGDPAVGRRGLLSVITCFLLAAFTVQEGVNSKITVLR